MNILTFQAFQDFNAQKFPVNLQDYAKYVSYFAAFHDQSNLPIVQSGDSAELYKVTGKLVKKYAHIEREDLAEYSAICRDAQIPFVGFSKNKYCGHKVVTDTSGGPWYHLDKDYKAEFVERRSKLFNAWGHNGMCANGTFYFKAPVKHWKLIDNGFW